MTQTPISEQATQQHEADEEAQWLREHVTEADRERRQIGRRVPEGADGPRDHS